MTRPLTPDEALAIADKLERWPGGMGYSLVRDPSRKRGWRRHEQKPWSVPPCEDADTMHCPVTQLHVARNGLEGSMTNHLDAFWSIAETLGNLWDVDRETARQHYNALLKNAPQELADEFRKVATL